ncbi:MAG: ferritin-like domain-containing protein [Thermoanaerobaculia bacterium]|nr:ferritin-like domain-containing protein [Thermoanaerobaculia bacterium]
MDSREFVKQLRGEMDEIFAKLGERQTLEAESEGNVDVVTLLKLALKSEIEASELAGYWMPSTSEIDVKMAFAQQCGDEMKHYNLILQRLTELGEDMSGYDPTVEGYSPLYQYLSGLRTTVERVAGGPFAREAVAEIRNAQFIEFCRAVGDEGTAKLYVDIIHPDEIHHHRMGYELLEKYALTEEQQALAATTVRSSLAIADELRTLAERATGLHSIPVS